MGTLITCLRWRRAFGSPRPVDPGTQRRRRRCARDVAQLVAQGFRGRVGERSGGEIINDWEVICVRNVHHKSSSDVSRL